MGQSDERVLGEKVQGNERMRTSRRLFAWVVPREKVPDRVNPANQKRIRLLVRKWNQAITNNPA